MRIAYALLALSLAANAAFVVTWALRDRSSNSAVDVGDEMPAGLTPVAVASAAQRPASAIAASATPAPAKPAPAREPGRPAWSLDSPPPGLGPVMAFDRGAVVPTVPLDRLAYRLGRDPTEEETAALRTMTFDGQLFTADALAREIAGRRARDEAQSHAGSALLRRIAGARSREHEKPDTSAAVLDAIAGREFDQAFPVGGYGPAISESDFTETKVLLADGATVSFGPGAFDVDLSRQSEALQYRPFPRDVTLVGAGSRRTLLRVRRGADSHGPIVNLVVRGVTLALENDLVDSRHDLALVRLVGCRVSGRRSLGSGGWSGAIWLDDCECVGDDGSEAMDVSSGVLVRMDRCLVALSEPFRPRGSTFGVLSGCTLREQPPRGHFEESPQIRLVQCVVERCSTAEEWSERARAARGLLEKELAKFGR